MKTNNSIRTLPTLGVEGGLPVGGGAVVGLLGWHE